MLLPNEQAGSAAGVVDESTPQQDETTTKAPSAPKVRETRQMAEVHFTDAIRSFYQHMDEGGKYAANVVLRGAVLVKDHEVSNRDFSELLKAGDVRLGAAKDTLLAGEPTPMRVVQPVRGESYVESKAHPYKQHGRIWRQLSYWQGNMNTSQKDVDNKVEMGVAEWPTGIVVKGKEYTSPADALLDGHGLVTVHVAWSNVIRPQMVDLSDYTPNGRKGRMVAAMEAGKGLGVTLRFFNKGQNREFKKSVKLAEIKAPEAIYGAVVGLLGLSYKGGSLNLDPDDKLALIAFIQDGTIPSNIPLKVEDTDTE
jgi:hypothetical protein